MGGGQGEVGGEGGGGVSEIFFCAHGREWGMRGQSKRFFLFLWVGGGGGLGEVGGEGAE